ncbi:glycosyl transferase family 4 [Candidatus Pacearchaeota archaeon]|nr:glycosyl transferase family 4 [Candidatus Pacearchaeota archaeon]|tara:strand:+ start:4009 stop:5019 length:1011 start_codon:yes stop_codon:yes gene_type:complete
MEWLLITSVLVSFLVTVLFLPSWIRRTKRANLVGKDLNKNNSVEISEAGGIIVIAGFLLGVLFYLAIRTFSFNTSINTIEILALISTILIVSFIGFIDDILGWKIGLGKRFRILLVIFAAIPLMVINAGTSIVYIPFLGVTNLGILFPLVLIPIGIAGAAISFNFLAGYNGLEAGQGIIILTALALASWLTGSAWLSVIALCMVGSLIGFLFFNSYPSQVFPGDVLTYSVGALIAIMAILGNYEQFAVFIFIPYIIETVLKSRGQLKKESFGVPQSDGSIKNKYKKFYGLEHVSIFLLEKFKKNNKAYEWEVVYMIYGLQVIFVILGILLFFGDKF